jgi:type IV pilus assembly protein PilM
MARQRAAIGVDIGSAAIKIVELSADGAAKGQPGIVRAVASAPMPAKAMEEGKITDVAAVGRVLRGLVQRQGVKTRRAAAAVNGQVALIREVRMPKLPPEEIRQAGSFEVQRYLPYPIAEVTFDAAIVGESKDNGAARVDVLVVAAKTDVLKQHAAVLKAAGLEPAVLEVEPLAVARAVANNAAPDHVTACVHVGSAVTMILVIEGQAPRVIRTVAFGTTHLLESTASRLAVNGEARDGLEARILAGGETITGYREALDESLSSLVMEIRRSLEYYSGRYQAAVPDRVVVTGGGAALPAFAASLNTALDMPVDVGDPFTGLGGAPKGAAPNSNAAYAVAAGLARRGVIER